MKDAHSVADAFLGGWQLNGVVTLQTGRHFTFGNSVDQSNTGSSNVRANVVQDPRLPKSQRTVQRFFDTSALAVPAAFSYGNAGRNSGEGPGQVNLDLSLFKSFFFNRDSSGHFRPNELQFRVEAFNVSNTPQFQNPNRILGTPQFGSITDLVNTARQIQFALKFFF
jgi:hypothetical protein